jgi:formylglycine-generating enzyme required for sulfatase activity
MRRAQTEDGSMVLSEIEQMRSTSTLPARFWDQVMEQFSAFQGGAGPLDHFISQDMLRRLFLCTEMEEDETQDTANFIYMTPDEVREYIYLTRSVVKERDAEREEVRTPFEPQTVRIAAGSFLMGMPESEADELKSWGVITPVEGEQTRQHEVMLPEYAISSYPVTVGEFRRFVEDGGYDSPDYWTDLGWKERRGRGWSGDRILGVEEQTYKSTQMVLGEDDLSLPVTNVSWYEAVAYCRWLSARTGRFYRLSTEAEWEKAASWDPSTEQRRRYPWGDEWDPERCSNSESDPGRLTPAGQYPDGKSAYGVGDMVGQVWEWCSSQYRPYPYDAADEREDLERSGTRVLRGGSFQERVAAAVCSCSFRSDLRPGEQHFDVGFRCVRDMSPA